MHSRSILKNSHLDITHTWETILFTQPKIKNINIYILKSSSIFFLDTKITLQKDISFSGSSQVKLETKTKQNHQTCQIQIHSDRKDQNIQTKNQTNPNGVYGYRMILWELSHKKDIFF